MPSSSASLLGPGAPNLPINFGMLGGITPVSLPFAFPGLLNLPTVTGTSAGANTANQSSSGYSLQPSEHLTYLHIHTVNYTAVSQ